MELFSTVFTGPFMTALKMITVSEYLAMDHASETKLEYYHGQIVAMAGARRTHNVIAANLIHMLIGALRGRPCEVYPSDQKVRTLTGAYLYPDVSVACTPQFEDEGENILTNPTVIIEVLSESTESRDRGVKFEHYRSIPSLREILFVAQDRRSVERYRRHSPDWIYTAFGPEEAQIELASLGVSLSLDEIYQRVQFPMPFEDEAGE